MFEKARAKRTYRKMVMDLKSYHQLMQNSKNYDGFDRGYIILPEKRVNINFTKQIVKLARKDRFNLSLHNVQHIGTGRESVMIVLDNESEEFKEKRREEIEEFVDSVLSETINQPRRNIVSLDEYKRHHH